MKIANEERTIPVNLYIPSDYPAEEILLFDIETTGFSAETNRVYLIGCSYICGSSLFITQYFSESPSDEALVISEFFKLLKTKKLLVHFNGQGFDIPFIQKRCNLLDIECDFSKITGLDLYKRIRPMKNFLGLLSLKQKAVEEFLSVNREDVYDGKKLIAVYNRYLSFENNEDLNLLFLHNHDDVYGMWELMRMLSYENIHCAEFLSFERIEENSLILKFKLIFPVPKAVSYMLSDAYISVSGNILSAKVMSFTGEMKHFFDNYKDYYYLPKEDTAMHRSVAVFVDKAYRKPATAENCYIKKAGEFIPDFGLDCFNSLPKFKNSFPEKNQYIDLNDLIGLLIEE